MKSIKKKVQNMTCGFDDIFAVNKLDFTFTTELINEIVSAWDYLNDKSNQYVQIVRNPSEMLFNSDDDDFNFAVCVLVINIEKGRTIYLECCDDCCSKCFSETITEYELLNLQC
jgi:ABC-type polysaccharide/polyol phosphate transport system ATPase subunit